VIRKDNIVFWVYILYLKSSVLLEIRALFIIYYLLLYVVFPLQQGYVYMYMKIFALKIGVILYFSFSSPCSPIFNLMKRKNLVHLYAIKEKPV
jgi:hypothetical protein